MLTSTYWHVAGGMLIFFNCDLMPQIKFYTDKMLVASDTFLNLT